MSEKNQATENNGGMSAKHSAPAHSRIGNGGGAEEFQHRTAAHHRDVHGLPHHFIVHNDYDMLKLPLGPERIFLQLVMQGGGKVGVVIFFSISAWFFLDKEQTIKSNLKRVWIMERELLF